jgi:diguanylate cyclase (GGDEF)-like protein
MSGDEPSSSSWTADQLTGFLAALSTADDQHAVLLRAADLVAEAVEAEVAAVVEAGAVSSVIGFAAGKAPEALMIELVSRHRPEVELPGLGAAQVLVAPLTGGAGGGLLVARLGAAPFTHEERNLVRGMGRVLSLTLRVSRTLETERATRQESERRASDNAALLHQLQERQALLDRLARIQRGLTGGATLAEVLEAVVAGAADLLEVDVVTLRQVVTGDPDYAEIMCAFGLDEGSPIGTRVRIGTGASGRAIAQNRLVVMQDYADDRDAYAGHVRSGIKSAMAAPVRENGQAVGSLVVASGTPGRQYTDLEQETLLVFADHASLAIAEARSAEALRHALAEARHDAMHDALTGLPNRALLKDRLTRAVKRATRLNGMIGLLFLDLDDFKHVNDSLGHDAGDKLLNSVAKRLRSCLRDEDTIARLGGDEFAILVEDLDSTKETGQVAARLLDALRAPFALSGRQVDVHASIGIATTDETTGGASLLRSADLAMYEAKRLGGGRWVRFEPDMHNKSLQRLDLEQELRRAIDTDQLQLHYQPIIDLTNGRVCAAEALARWPHPDRGMIPPAEFIPVAEEARLIGALGEWVLRRACADAATWRPDVSVTVNVSPSQVTSDLPRLVVGVLGEAQLGPDRLTLELTEATAMTDAPATLAAMQQLHDVGVRIAIDDFGTGYSSLARLQSLPVDMLKIDRSFIATLDQHVNASAIVSAIVALSRGTGLVTIAEGVESARQVETLASLGCDRAQGFHLGRPAPAQDLANHLLPTQAHARRLTTVS